MKKTKKKEQKAKKKKKTIGKVEFFFDVISISLVILLGILFGYRSLYYYSKQNQVQKKEEETLKAAVIRNNKITTEENGLHQEEDGYIFKGIVDNNYVSFGNRLYRIMEINEDNSVKIVSNSNEAILNWGEDANYQNSNPEIWLNKVKDNVYSGVYQKTVPGETKLLKKTKWCDGVLTEKKVKCEQYQNTYFSLLSLDDYVRYSGGNSYLYNQQLTWLLGKNSDQENLYIDSDGSIGSASMYDGYGIRVVMTLKKNIKITGGSGTLGDPYVINQEGMTNYINQYVKLGEDVYRVYEENDQQIRLVLNDYIKENGQYVEKAFSNDEAIYSPLNRYSVAYYLNRDFYNSRPYNYLLAECQFPIGEVSTTNGLQYYQQFAETISNKIGIPSLYDLNNNSLSDYYLINTTGSSMAWFYNKNGHLEEERAKEAKKIVPTICLDKTLIKNGEGKIENPYVVE